MIVIPDLLAKKRDGRALEPTEIAAFVQGVVTGEVSRPQAAAFLMASFIHGLSDDEAAALTRAMTDSGQRFSWAGMDGPFIDKHSTGGVGDKVSLILAPLWAELGWRVPMISGRGLGFTGGTLDKLESIPGFRTDLDADILRKNLREVGCFMAGQTPWLAPADRVLYALRNETATVPCIPLIVASILSKKLAEGLDKLVLDVKTGSGAFMETRPRARALAQSLVRVAKANGVDTCAYITDMDQPLGEACGNALEVVESVACLKGEGPADLRALVLRLAQHPDAARVLDSGAAYERFCRMSEAHGGRLEALTVSAKAVVVEAPASGTLARCDALGVGRAAFVLGAGRQRAEDPVRPGVGVVVHKKRGERVEAGEPLATLYHEEVGLEEALAAVKAAFVLGEPEEIPLVWEEIR